MKKLFAAIAALLYITPALAQVGPGPTPNPWIVNGSQVYYAMGCVDIVTAPPGACHGKGSLTVDSLWPTALTVAGTATFNSAVTISPATGAVAFAPTAVGTINNMSIGVTTAAAGNFTSIGQTSSGPGIFTTLGATSAISAYTGTAIAAGGSAGVGFKFSSVSNFGMFFGSGAPTLSAARGSLYLRSDGAAGNTQLYINSNGTTGWTGGLSGTLAGNTTVFNTQSGTITNGHVAVADASGNLVDGGPPGVAFMSWAGVKTTAFTATSNMQYCVDTLTTGAVTMTLPSAPNDGDKVQFIDCKSHFAIASLTVARNGKTIMGLAQDMTVNTNNASATMVYVATYSDWRMF